MPSTALLDADLTAGNRTDAFDADIAAGWSSAPTPPRRTEVDRGSTVDYVVSRGPEPTPTPEPTPATVLVPDVRGFHEADAVNTLIDAGLTPGDRTEPSTPTSPLAGHRHRPGRDDRGRPRVDRRLRRLPGRAHPRADTRADTRADPAPTPEPTPEPTPDRRPSPPRTDPATVLVPDVRGFQEADAVNTLIDADLTPGDRSDAFDADHRRRAGHRHRPGRDDRGRPRVDRRLRRLPAAPSPPPNRPRSRPRPPVAVPDLTRLRRRRRRQRAHRRRPPAG